jgi:hypothetical protein
LILQAGSAIRKCNGNAILRVLEKSLNLTDMNNENWCGWLVRPIDRDGGYAGDNGYYHDGSYAGDDRYYHQRRYARDDYQSNRPGIDVHF